MSIRWCFKILFAGEKLKSLFTLLISFIFWQFGLALFQLECWWCFTFFLFFFFCFCFCCCWCCCLTILFFLFICFMPLIVKLTFTKVIGFSFVWSLILFLWHTQKEEAEKEEKSWKKGQFEKKARFGTTDRQKKVCF